MKQGTILGSTALLLGAVVTLSCARASNAASAGTTGAARFDSAGHLLFPTDYRRWVFLSSGRGMSYSAAAAGAAEPVFDNVFVDPASYDSFLKAGTWPDGTMLVLEVRGGQSKGSINLHGAFQAGNALAREIHVKDTKRFKDGWAFFDFDGEKPASMIPVTASCYSCHRDHAAVDTTFVQFYPTLLPISTKAGTLSKAYRDEEGARR